MSQTVLVPVDGSPFGEHAIPWGVAAAGDGGTVHFVHVHEMPPPLLIEGVVVSDPRVDATLRESESDYLGRLLARVKAVAPSVSATARNLDTDESLADALAKTAADSGAGLIAMTTHGRGPFARFWLGSVTDDLLGVSPVPVLLHRAADDAAPDLAARPSVHRLIVPIDGTELSERILAPAVRFAQTFGAELVLLLVLEVLDDVNQITRVGQAGVPMTPADRAKEYLELAARVVASHGVTARTEFVVHGSPAKAILAAAGDDPASGVALATHGRTGVMRLLKGSVADEVIRHAVGPVLAFHPPDPDEAAA